MTVGLHLLLFAHRNQNHIMGESRDESGSCGVHLHPWVTVQATRRAACSDPLLLSAYERRVHHKWQSTKQAATPRCRGRTVGSCGWPYTARGRVRQQARQCAPTRTALAVSNNLGIDSGGPKIATVDRNVEIALRHAAAGRAVARWCKRETVPCRRERPPRSLRPLPELPHRRSPSF